MRACWNHNPEDRPGMAQVVEWSQLPELQSLRTIHQLVHKKILAICQCSVAQSQHATNKPQKKQNIIPNCDHFVPLFSSSEPLSREKQENTTNDYIQMWIAQDNVENSTKLTIVTCKSDHFGFNVRKIL